MNQPPAFHHLRPLLQQSLAEGKETAVLLNSNSMSPLFWADDHILLVAATSTQLAPGDIITLAETGGLVTHRYWGQTADGKLLARGDRAMHNDPPWPTAALVGRVVGRKRSSRMLHFEQGRGKWLAKGVRGLTAVNHTLLTHYPHAVWLRSVHRLLFGLRWLLTAVVR